MYRSTINPVPDGRSYSQKQREKRDNLEELLNKQHREDTSIQNIDRIAGAVTAARSPRYRKVTTTADLQNTGIINGEKMHPGDWVLFTGIAVGIWQSNRLMQWDGHQWSQLPIENNWDKYLLAVSDIAQGTADGVFNTAFITQLFADMIHVQVLNVLTQLNVGGFDGNRIQICGGNENNGEIRSSNFSEADRTGFRIQRNGRADFQSVNSLEFAAGALGYLPVGFVYFQLRGQPEPAALFAGVWENISADYAGLFFRVAGGNAAPFGQDQNMMIQSHRHTNRENSQSSFPGGTGSFGTVGTPPGNSNTGWEGGIETRPVNTTIEVWIRRS